MKTTAFTSTRLLFVSLLSVLLIYGFACGDSDSSSPIASSDSGGGGGDGGSSVGGSLARFTIYGDYLYSVDFQSINVFDISDPKNPQLVTKRQLGDDIETIFAFDNTLYIGTMSGMFIVDITDPKEPSTLSRYEHIIACDPVVTDGSYSYVTLRSAANCGFNIVNELQVIDTKDKTSPVRINTIQMRNPQGLGIKGDILYVCDDGDIVIFDISDRENPTQIDMLETDAFDVIPLPDRLIAIGNNTLAQYTYVSDGESLELLSSISL
jgi:hypothetical protein